MAQYDDDEALTAKIVIFGPNVTEIDGCGHPLD